jgi:hypothetical protein
MSKITIVNNCKFGSDARVLQVVSKFMDEKIGDDFNIDYIGNGVWEISEGEGIYTLTTTNSSVVGDIKIKVTLELTDIEN